MPSTAKKIENPTLINLPAEISDLIIRNVEEVDLISIRAVCKALNRIVHEPFGLVFFKTRYHALSEHSIKALLKITKSATLGPFVQEVIFNIVVPDEGNSNGDKTGENTGGMLVFSPEGCDNCLEWNSRKNILSKSKLYSLSAFMMRNIKKRHGSIALGINDSDPEKRCYGLKKLLAANPCSKHYIISPGIVFLTLALLFRQAQLQDCGINSVNIDMSGHATRLEPEKRLFIQSGLRNLFDHGLWLADFPGTHGTQASSLKSLRSKHTLRLAGVGTNGNGIFHHDPVAENLLLSNCEQGDLMMVNDFAVSRGPAPPSNFTHLTLAHCTIDDVESFLFSFEKPFQYVQSITLRDIHLSRRGAKWSGILRALSEAPKLESCRFEHLTTTKMPLRRDPQLVHKTWESVGNYKVEGGDVKKELSDLVAFVELLEFGMGEPLQDGACIVA